MMAEGIPSYDELKLRIHRRAEGDYEIVAFGPDGSTASGTFSVPFNEMELKNFVLEVGRPRRGVRAFRSSHMEEAKHFGAQLFEALVTGDVRDVYQGARRVAEQRQRGLRVTLYMTDVPELLGIPREFLYERPSFLAQSIYTPVVRSLDLKSARPPAKLTLPLRILGVVSAPQGFETLDVDSEKQKLADALRPLKGLTELRWLERGTLAELEASVDAPDEVHVLHYIGHGAYDKRTEEGILVFENARGEPHEVTGESLGSLLQDETSLRLVVLNSCEGARGSEVDPFSGVAASLVEFRIPAVIGMQFEITDEAAITFASRLYRALAQGFPVDAALAQARKAVFAAGYDTEFATPVLFLRAADARLFDVQQPPSEPDDTDTTKGVGRDETATVERRGKWACELVEKTLWTRSLRVRSGSSTHMIEFRRRAVGDDEVLVDGAKVWTGMVMPALKKAMDFEVAVGSGHYSAAIVVRTSAFTLRIVRFQLSIAGSVLYSDDG